MERQPPPFFNRGPAPLVRLMFFVALALLLMVLDARFRYAETLRAGLALLAYPIQRVAMAPVQLATGVIGFFSSQVQLQRDNDALREKQLRLAKDLVTLEGRAAGNARLRGPGGAGRRPRAGRRGQPERRQGAGRPGAGGAQRTPGRGRRRGEWRDPGAALHGGER